MSDPGSKPAGNALDAFLAGLDAHKAPQPPPPQPSPVPGAVPPPAPLVPPPQAAAPATPSPQAPAAAPAAPAKTPEQETGIDPLAAPPPPPAPPPPKPEAPGIGTRVLNGAKSLLGLGTDSSTADAVSGAVTGALGGIARSGAEAVHGAGEAVRDLREALPDAVSKPLATGMKTFGELLNSVPEVYPGQHATAAIYLLGSGQSDAHENDLMAARDYLAKVGDSSINEGVAQLGSLVLGAEGVDELRLFAWAPKLIKGAANYGAASALLTDPDSARLTSALRGLGVDTEFTNWLGADAKDAPAWENRVKNGLENTLVGVPLDAAMSGLKFLWTAMRPGTGAVERAAAQIRASDALREAIPTAPDEVMHPIAQHLTVQDEVANEAAFANWMQQRDPSLLSRAQIVGADGTPLSTLTRHDFQEAGFPLAGDAWERARDEYASGAGPVSLDQVPAPPEYNGGERWVDTISREAANRPPSAEAPRDLNASSPTYGRRPGVVARGPDGMIEGSRVTGTRGDGRLSSSFNAHYNPPDGNNAFHVQGHYDATTKDIHVGWAGSDQGPLSWGHSATRTMLRVLMDNFPEAETITGFRVSGARAGRARVADSPAGGDAAMPLPGRGGRAAIERANRMRQRMTPAARQSLEASRTASVSTPDTALNPSVQGATDAVGVYSPPGPLHSTPTDPSLVALTDAAREHLPGAPEGASEVPPGGPPGEPPSGPPGPIGGDRGRAALETPSGYARANAADRPSTDPNYPTPTGPLIPPVANQESVVPMLRDVTYALHDTPHMIRSDADTMTYAQTMAQATGMEPVDMLAFAQTIAGRTGDLAPAMATIRTFWERFGQAVDVYATRPVSGLSQDERIQLKRAIYNVNAFTSSFKDVQAGMGRGFRAMRFNTLEDWIANERQNAAQSGTAIPMMDPGITRAMEMDRPSPPFPTTDDELQAWLDMWNATRGAEGDRLNFLSGTQTIPSALFNLRTSFANLFTANALCGLPSVSMNVVSPALQAVWHTMSTSLGGMMTAPFMKDPAARRAAMALSVNAVRAYGIAMGETGSAIKYAIQAARENRSILGAGQSMDMSRMAHISSSQMRQYGTLFGRISAGPLGDHNIDSWLGGAALNAPAQGVYWAGNLINLWPRTYQRVNGMLDEFAQRLSYHGEVAVQALTEATQMGLTRDQTKMYVEGSLRSAYDPLTQAANNPDLLREAGRTTLTNSLVSDYRSDVVNRLASGIQAMRHELPESRYILPVFNVPANTLGEIIRQIPGVNMLLSETREELLGNLGIKRQADAYGRMMLASGLMLYGYSLARAGLLTGPGPDNVHDKAAWNDEYQPYSFRTAPDGNWVDYSRFGPPGALLGIPAVHYDKNVYQPTDKMHNTLMAAIGAMAQYLKGQASLEGLGQIMDFGGDPSQSDTIGRQLLGSTAEKLLVPNFVTQLGRNTQDPNRRQMPEWQDYVTNGIPWESETLDPVRNVFGEYIHVPRDTLIENLMPITMSPTVPGKHDPELAELTRLYESTGYAAGVVHQADISNGYYDSRTIKLEDGRSLFDAITRARQTVQVGGQTLRQAIAETINDPRYKAAKDGDAATLVDAAGNLSRGAIIQRVFKTYEAAAVAEVGSHSDLAKKYLAATKAKQQNSDTLAQYGVDDLVNNPGLAKANHVDLQRYQDALFPDRGLPQMPQGSNPIDNVLAEPSPQ